MIDFNVTKSPCLLPGSDTSDPCDDVVTDSRCEDLEFAADNPNICPDGSPISGFTVVPASGTVEVGARYPFRALLTFANGKEWDVTERAIWSTGNAGIALIVSGGIATGVAAGTTTIDATYRGYSDTSTLTVVAACQQSKMDLILVIDRSASMNQVEADGKTRMEGVKLAAKALARNLNYLKDQCAVVSFAGIIDGSNKTEDSTLHLVLSPVQSDIDAAIDAIAVQDEPRIYTGIGGGLKKAYDEMVAHGRSGARKVIVLLTDGMENICSPNPATVATTIKGAGIVIEVVALATDDVTVKDCASSSTTVNTFLTSLCSCNLFHTAASKDDLINIFSNIPNEICQANTGGCLTYINPGTPPVAPTCQSPKLDYDGFINWNVVRGFVDLIGMGTNLVALYDLQPGNGLYVDMVGTDQSQADFTKKDTLGILETKKAFSLAPGRYRVSLYIAGNNRQDRSGDKLKVSLGNVWSQVVQVDNWKQNFTLYTWDVNVTGPSAGKLRIESLPLPKDAVQTIGLIIDRVKLLNVDTNETLLYDDFDGENPC